MYMYLKYRFCTYSIDFYYSSHVHLPSSSEDTAICAICAICYLTLHTMCLSLYTESKHM